MIGKWRAKTGMYKGEGGEDIYPDLYHIILEFRRQLDNYEISRISLPKLQGLCNALLSLRPSSFHP
jgi:hypothetical protein